MFVSMHKWRTFGTLCHGAARTVAARLACTARSHDALYVSDPNQNHSWGARAFELVFHTRRPRPKEDAQL
jgi:hypothetical protein